MGPAIAAIVIIAALAATGRKDDRPLPPGRPDEPPPYEPPPPPIDPEEWSDVSQLDVGDPGGDGYGLIPYWTGQDGKPNEQQRLWNYEAVRSYGMVLSDTGLVGPAFGTFLMVVAYIESRGNPAVCVSGGTCGRNNDARGIFQFRPKTAWDEGDLDELEDWEFDAIFSMPWSVAMAADLLKRLKKRRLSAGELMTALMARRGWRGGSYIKNPSAFNKAGGLNRWNDGLDHFGIPRAFSDVVIDLAPTSEWPDVYELAALLEAPFPD